MARRPEFPAKSMTREELKDLKRSLSLLSPHTVRGNYSDCRQVGGCEMERPRRERRSDS